MSVSQLWFSLNGRIPRSTYWLSQVIGVNAVVIVCTMVGSGMVSRNSDPIEGAISGYTIGGLLCLWPTIAIGTKRCHDRGRSGAFMLLLLVPVIGLWPAVEMAFISGTKGDNEYGHDPLCTADTDGNA